MQKYATCEILGSSEVPTPFYSATLFRRRHTALTGPAAPLPTQPERGSKVTITLPFFGCCLLSYTLWGCVCVDNSACFSKFTVSSASRT